MSLKELFYDLKKIKDKNFKLLNNPMFLLENNRFEQLMINELFSVEKIENELKFLDSIIVFKDKLLIDLENEDEDTLKVETFRDLYYFLDIRNDREDKVLEKPILYSAQLEELKLISLKDSESGEEVLVFKKL